MATSARALHGSSRKANKAKRRPKQKRGSYVPVAEQVRMCTEYMQGGSDNSIQKIAKRFDRDAMCVSRIVKSESMEEIAQEMRKAILKNEAEGIVERIHYEVAAKKSKAGAWIAMELAERIGAIPPKIRQSGFVGRFNSPIDIKIEDDNDRVSDIVKKLTEITMERGRLFGMPMPEIDEMKEDIPIEVSVLKREQAE